MGNPGPSEAGFHFVDDYERCRKYWYYSHFVGLEPLNISPTLIYGLAVHEGMEGWYLALFQNQPVHERVTVAKQMFMSSMVVSKHLYLFEDTYIADVNKGLEMFEEYGLHYSGETWKVAVVGGEPAVEMPLRANFPNGDLFTGRVDLVLESSEGRRYVVDHKTTGWSMANVVKNLNVSDQATGYLWLWNKNNPSMRALGVMFNIFRFSKGKYEFKQLLVYKSQNDIKEFVADYQDIFNEIAMRIADPNARWKRNRDACFKYNKPCQYMDICAGANYEHLIGSQFKYRERPDDKKS